MKYNSWFLILLILYLSHIYHTDHKSALIKVYKLFENKDIPFHPQIAILNNNTFLWKLREHGSGLHSCHPPMSKKIECYLGDLSMSWLFNFIVAIGALTVVKEKKEVRAEK